MGLHADGTTDPPEVRNWRIHLFACIASMSAIAMGYDTSVIGGTLALDSFRRAYNTAELSASARDTLAGNIVSTFQAGCFFGSLIAFPFGEKCGRKKAVLYASLVFLLGGTIMTAATGKIGMIIGGRAIAGLGIGAVSMLVPIYISECSPPSIRGRLVGIFEVASQAGGMVGFWINYGVDRSISDAVDAQWIVPLGIQLLPGILLFVGMFFCPESPRWLARQDKWEQAEKTLVFIRMLPSEDPYIQQELSDIRHQVEERSTLKLSKKDQAKKLFQKGTRNRLAIGLLLMACQNLTGVNIITYYSPRIFETLGITGTDTKLFATGFYGLAKTLGMILFSIYLVEKVGRRMGLIYGAFIGSLPMWYIGGYVFKADPATAAAQGAVTRDGWGYLAMVCVYLYGFIYCATWQGITWVYCSEIFPLDIRLLCVAITTADQWFWSFLISRTTPYMITSLGYGTYMFFGALMVLMGFWAFFFIPETKGLSLEDMDNLFMGSMHRAVWDNLRNRKHVPARAVDMHSPRDSLDKKEKDIEITAVESVPTRQ
ncbi:Hexose transporter 2 [Elsinoe australis]|uniref:Hexose transporter 2 n=1 Tax=Elsinoe australis TaxID=40998 RepID=A0A2P8A4N7_9PEZI|nr:Hexose transporter 2 [Elsinoe australis]